VSYEIAKCRSCGATFAVDGEIITQRDADAMQEGLNAFYAGHEYNGHPVRVRSLMRERHSGAKALPRTSARPNESR
jgi:hypothetical protein